MLYMFCLLIATALSLSDIAIASSIPFDYRSAHGEMTEIAPPPLRSNLISLVIRYLSSQATHNLFQDSLYPIARHHPTIFGGIVQKLLEDGDHPVFIDLFIASAPKDLFMQYIEINNGINSDQIITKLDLWKTLHFWTDSVIKATEYRKFIHNVSYIASSNRFNVTTKVIPTSLTIIQCPTICCVNWSEIPHYLTSMRLQFPTWKHSVVDLSEMDQLIHIQKLEIDLRNGSVVFPDYTLPDSLKTLKLINLSSQQLDYNKLW
eukprot:357118_1